MPEMDLFRVLTDATSRLAAGGPAIRAARRHRAERGGTRRVRRSSMTSLPCGKLCCNTPGAQCAASWSTMPPASATVRSGNRWAGMTGRTWGLSLERCLGTGESRGERQRATAVLAPICICACRSVWRGAGTCLARANGWANGSRSQARKVGAACSFLYRCDDIGHFLGCKRGRAEPRRMVLLPQLHPPSGAGRLPRPQALRRL